MPNLYADTFSARLAKVLEMPLLSYDEEGCIRVKFLDTIEVTTMKAPDRDLVVLYADLGELPAEPPVGLLLDMLDANCFWEGTGGATLSVLREPEHPLHLVLAQHFELGSTQGAEVDLEDRIKMFLTAAYAWHLRLNADELSKKEGESPTATSPTPTSSSSSQPSTSGGKFELPPDHSLRA